MSTAPAPGLLARLRALDPERSARRLAPAGVVACAAGVGVGGRVGLVLALVGVALLLTSCASREHGLLVYQVDMTRGTRGVVRFWPSRRDRAGRGGNCGGQWNATYDAGRGEIRTFRHPFWKVRLEVLRRLADGSLDVRVTLR